MAMLKRLWLRFWAWAKADGAFLIANPLALGAVTVGFVVGLGAGWLPAESGFDYVWRDPEMCDDCHVHDYANEAYFRSVHVGLTTCHDCHMVPIAHYPRNLVLTPLSDGVSELEHVPHVDSVICSTCHMAGHEGELSGPMTADVLERVVKVDESPLHMLHLEAEVRDPGPARGGDTNPHGATPEEGHDNGHDEGHDEGGGGHGGETRTISCMDCHGSENNRAHRFEATRENCLRCHEGISESSGRLAELQCHECHFEGFLGREATTGVQASASHDGGH